MALVACIGYAIGHAEVWSRYPETMVITWIDLHIGCCRHVAVDAIGRTGIMQLVFSRCELAGGMALQADGRPRRSQFQTMWVVAITAGDAGLVHAALEE